MHDWLKNALKLLSSIIVYHTEPKTKMFERNSKKDNHVALTSHSDGLHDDQMPELIRKPNPRY